MTWPRGIRLLVVLLLLVWMGRFSVLFPLNISPTHVSSPREVLVFLGEGFPKPGIHQFSDGATPRSVIQLTFPERSIPSAIDPGLELSLRSGETLEIFQKKSQRYEIMRYWMPALMRMTLFIPLHPDHMRNGDWEALPGIGPELSKRIEENRQKNGEFGSLEALRRVPGIGDKLLERLKPYF